jgi:hypothetical protein
VLKQETTVSRTVELMNRSSKRRPRQKRQERGKTVLERKESEDALDRALQDTYPASDPLAIIQPGHEVPAGIEK